MGRSYFVRISCFHVRGMCQELWFIDSAPVCTKRFHHKRDLRTRWVEAQGAQKRSPSMSWLHHAPFQRGGQNGRIDKQTPEPRWCFQSHWCRASAELAYRAT